MLYLKDAFRYQNTLSRLINQTVAFLSVQGNVTVTTQEHYRKKANPDAEDETITVEANRSVRHDNNTVIAFLEHLLDEKIKLAKAISDAKRTCDDIDADLSANRVRQKIAETLTNLSRVRASEAKITGRAYKFNATGEQVPYTYDIKQVTTIDFDRNTVRKMARHYDEEADRISAKIDRLMVDIEVDYQPEFGPSDNLEDAIETWQPSKD